MMMILGGISWSISDGQAQAIRVSENVKKLTKSLASAVERYNSLHAMSSLYPAVLSVKDALNPESHVFDACHEPSEVMYTMVRAAYCFTRKTAVSIGVCLLVVSMTK